MENSQKNEYEWPTNIFKKGLSQLVTEEVQIQATLKFHLIPVSTGTLQKPKYKYLGLYQ